MCSSQHESPDGLHALPYALYVWCKNTSILVRSFYQATYIPMEIIISISSPYYMIKNTRSFAFGPSVFHLFFLIRMLLVPQKYHSSIGQWSESCLWTRLANVGDHPYGTSSIPLKSSWPCIPEQPLDKVNVLLLCTWTKILHPNEWVVTLPIVFFPLGYTNKFLMQDGWPIHPNHLMAIWDPQDNECTPLEIYHLIPKLRPSIKVFPNFPCRHKKLQNIYQTHHIHLIVVLSSAKLKQCTRKIFC